MLVLIVLILLNLSAFSQSRVELKKCIDTYRSQYVQRCIIPAEDEEIRKGIASWMFINDFSFNAQTDSSVTFSRPISYGGVEIDIPWQEQWFCEKFQYQKHKYTGVVTVRVGIHEVKHGKDISVLAMVRKRGSNVYDECRMQHLEPELRDYLFSFLDFEVPIWPESLAEAVDRYNITQIYPDRKLSLR